ncbi:MAG: hypothetical protein P8Y68_13980, partial [Anaerolineales bacterium]
INTIKIFSFHFSLHFKWLVLFCSTINLNLVSRMRFVPAIKLVGEIGKLITRWIIPPGGGHGFHL